MKNFLRKYSLCIKLIPIILSVILLFLYKFSQEYLFVRFSYTLIYGYIGYEYSKAIKSKKVFITTNLFVFLGFFFASNLSTINFIGHEISIISILLIFLAIGLFIYVLSLIRESDVFISFLNNTINRNEGFWENMIPPEFQEERFGDLLELNDYLKDKGSFIFRRWVIIGFQFVVIVLQVLYQKAMGALGRNQVGKNK